MAEQKRILIYKKDGTILTFTDISHFTDGNDYVKFRYPRTDGIMEATFYERNMLGYSISV